MNGTLKRHTDHLGTYYTVHRADGTKAGIIYEGRNGGLVAHSMTGHSLRRYTCLSGWSPGQVADELLTLTDPYACPEHRATPAPGTMGQAHAAIGSLPRVWAQWAGKAPEPQCCARGAHARYLSRAALREVTRD
jgi:hypothetical protein